MDKEYYIQDLVDIDRLRILFEDFSRATGFTTGFVSYPGQELLITTGWRDICTKFHRTCPASAGCCKESNIYLTTCLKDLKELSIKPCGNGLVDGATPVVIRGKHLASLVTGQVLLAPPDINFFKGLAQEYGYDTEEYLAALAKVPVITEEQLKRALLFLSGLAVQIAEEGLSKLQLEETTNDLRIDISSRTKAEEALRRALGTLHVLKECDMALARANSEAELLNSVCRILMDIWGAQMTWVGLAEDDPTKTVRVASHSASDEGYCENLDITWADELRGRGPVGTAIRTQKAVICRNIGSNPYFAPWREKALKRGYSSMVALPLISGNHCLGALMLYSTQADAFNNEEVELLERLAGDLAYGILSLRTRAERDQLQSELLAISEREKQHIAQELHDGLCQHFAGIAMMSSLLHRRLVAREDPEAEKAGQICDLLNTGVMEARNLSHGLHPVKAETDGLMQALSTLAQTVTNFFHVQCSFRCQDPVLVNDQSVATHLFRMTQEAINNAIKHGQARRVVITLKNSHKEIALSIRDNGIGIRTNRLPSNGMGMHIMNHRASEIGATLSVCRAGRRGTVVTCTLPTDRNGSQSL